MPKHQCTHCSRAPFSTVTGLNIHIARKHAVRTVTAGRGSSKSHQCEYCDHAPFKTRIAVGMHRKRAHSISAKQYRATMASPLQVQVRELLKVQPILIDARIVQVPEHKVKFCPGCAFPVRDLLDGAHAEGSPFKLQVCPVCLMPMKAILAVEQALEPKQAQERLQVQPPRRHETPAIAG